MLRETIQVKFISTPVERNAEGATTVLLNETNIVLNILGSCERNFPNQLTDKDDWIVADYRCEQTIKKILIDMIERDYKYRDDLWVVSIHTMGNANVTTLAFKSAKESEDVYNKIRNWWLSE